MNTQFASKASTSISSLPINSVHLSNLKDCFELEHKITGMSKRRTPGSGIKGAELFEAISTLEELEKLSQVEELEEAVGEGMEASQGLAAKVVSEKIADLLATLREKAEGPLVSSANLILSFDDDHFL